MPNLNHHSSISIRICLAQCKTCSRTHNWHQTATSIITLSESLHMLTYDSLKQHTVASCMEVRKLSTPVIGSCYTKTPPKPVRHEVLWKPPYGLTPQVLIIQIRCARMDSHELLTLGMSVTN